MTSAAEMWPPWAWIAIVAIVLGIFRGGRRNSRFRYRPDEASRVVEREDPRVDELQARVSELENRLDFAERLLAGREPSALSSASAPRNG